MMLRTISTAFLLSLCTLAFGCGSASAGLITSTVPLGTKRYKVLRQASTTVHWFEPNFILFNWPGTVPFDQAQEELMAGGAKPLVDKKASTDKEPSASKGSSADKAPSGEKKTAAGDKPAAGAGTKTAKIVIRGDALINVRYWTDQFYLPGFYVHRLHIKGDVIKFTR